MKALSRYIALCTATFCVAFATSFILSTDRIYTHFFYIPIAVAASHYPRFTGPIGICFAGVHILVELLLRGQIDVVTCFRGGIMIIVAYSLAGIWEREQRYQNKIKELDYQRCHDGLTGVYNRNYFSNLDYDKLMYPLALFALDVDGLKKINDNLGHLVGDQYIVGTTQVFKSCLREGDGLIRMGGDEFLMIVESCDETRAGTIEERVKEGLIHFNAGRDTAIMPVELDFSIASVICHGAHTFHRDFEKADYLMYEHKVRKKKAAQGPDTIVSEP